MDIHERMEKGMERVSFFCELPPPYGGVTVKNQLLIDEVFSSLDDLNTIDFCKIKRNPFQLIPVSFKMLMALLRNDIIVYGFGSYKRLNIALKIQRMIGGKSSLAKSINIVMGGTIADAVDSYPGFSELLRSININLVETEGLKQSLIKAAIKNVDVFPNPKLSKGARRPVKNTGPLRCVFFSKICAEKGCEYIMDELGDTADNLISVDFYGHVDENIKERFERFVDTHSNVSYHGVFDSAKNDVYAEINRYDVLLFPSTWSGEGVPGILIEAKMAGILPVVSDWKFNREIVQDNKEGIVLDTLAPGTLRAVILSLATDRERVDALKAGSYQSRDRYSLENYRNKLLQMLIEKENTD